MKQYELCGFLNMFDIVPDFVYPIFQYRCGYYFQEGENDIITDFVPVKPLIYSRVQQISNYKDIIGIRNKKLEINSKPLYAFQTSQSKIICGESDVLLNFFDNYRTENVILKEEIQDFRNEIIDAFLIKTTGEMDKKSPDFKICNLQITESAFINDMKIGNRTDILFNKNN